MAYSVQVKGAKYVKFCSWILSFGQCVSSWGHVDMTGSWWGEKVITLKFNMDYEIVM